MSAARRRYPKTVILLLQEARFALSICNERRCLQRGHIHRAALLERLGAMLAHGNEVPTSRKAARRRSPGARSREGRRSRKR